MLGPFQFLKLTSNYISSTTVSHLVFSNERQLCAVKKGLLRFLSKSEVSKAKIKKILINTSTLFDPDLHRG
jgi:hypothetical protein